MVGYFENDPMSASEKLFAGVSSGIITRAVTQPMDVVKVRAQLIKKARRSVSKIARKIYTEEGLKAFFQGHAMGQIHSILSVSSQFYIYELTTKLMSHNEFGKNYKAASSFLCGSAAGCVSTTLVIPLEVIRVRQILVHEQYGGLIHGAKNVYRSGGIKAFYEGLSASLLQMGPSVGISFTTFRLIQSMILHAIGPSQAPEPHKMNVYKPEVMVLATSVAGCLAGFLSKTITYPFDLVKKRLQIASHVVDDDYYVPSQVKRLVACKNLRECFINCYKKEGIRGFFRGWTVTVYKAQLTSVVAFTSYEMCCYVIRSLIKT